RLPAPRSLRHPHHEPSPSVPVFALRTSRSRDAPASPSAPAPPDQLPTCLPDLSDLSDPTDPPALPDPPVLPVRFLTDLVLLQLLVQVAAGRADHFGGLRDVPAVFAELADQKHALRVLLELAQRPQLRRVAVAGRRRAPPAARGRPHAVGQIRQIDRVGAGHDDQLLDGVAKLADVALPPVAAARV